MVFARKGSQFDHWLCMVPCFLKPMPLDHEYNTYPDLAAHQDVFVIDNVNLVPTACYVYMAYSCCAGCMSSMFHARPAQHCSRPQVMPPDNDIQITHMMNPACAPCKAPSNMHDWATCCEQSGIACSFHAVSVVCMVSGGKPRAAWQQVHGQPMPLTSAALNQVTMP